MADAAKTKKQSRGSVNPQAKKKKLTKADRERKKREERERKALEEENTRIKASEDAKLRKIREAEEKLLMAKQENEERKVRRQDMEELKEILDNNDKYLMDMNNNQRVQAKWARYMRCDGSPDPVNQREINTYINLRLEDNTHDDAKSVLRDSQLDLALIDELKFLLVDTPAEQLSEKEINLCQQTIEKLEELIKKKLDLATVQLLCDTSCLENSETGNLLHTVMNDEIILCVWGNIIKNPRIRSIEFPEARFTFEIPRVLALSDCAVRVLITKYDHYSYYSPASFARMKKEDEPEPTQKETEEKKEVKEDENVDKEKVEEEVKEEHTLGMMAALMQRALSGEQSEPKPEEEPVEVIEEDYKDPPTPKLPEWEEFDEEDDVIDLRAYDVLGGIYVFNLLHLPPQPKTVNKWTITQLIDPPELYPLEYVPDPVHTDYSKDTKKDEKPPIGISMVLPQDVIFLEQPLVASWDSKRKFWTTKGFSEPSFNEEARTFNFKMSSFGTFCLLQDSHINMPFQSWEIRPHKLNSAVFTVTAAIVEVQIEISDALCCLSQPRDRPELESIRDKWVTPAELIVMMKKAGVNIFPNEDSYRFVSIQSKNPLIEERMYQQMALTASSMAYSWSKWNGERARDEIVFQGAEAKEDVPLMEEEWSVFLATKRRVTKLKMTEYEHAFEEETKEDLKRLESSQQITAISSRTNEPGNDRRDSRSSKSLSVLRRLALNKTSRPKSAKESKSKDIFFETFNLKISPVSVTFVWNLYLCFLAHFLGY